MLIAHSSLTRHRIPELNSGDFEHAQTGGVRVAGSRVALLSGSAWSARCRPGVARMGEGEGPPRGAEDQADDRRQEDEVEQDL